MRQRRSTIRDRGARLAHIRAASLTCFLLIVVCAGLAQADARAATPEVGLIAHWRFDEGQGSSAVSAADRLAPARVSGATWAPGRHGGALAFDGKDDYVDAGAVPLDRKAMTVAAWIRPDRVRGGGRNPIAGKQGNGQRGFMFMVETDGRLAVEVWKDARTPTKLRGGDVLTAGRWTHVAVTYSLGANGQADARLYVDGKPVARTASAVGPIASNTAPFEIGRYNWSRSYTAHCQGRIDEVRLYSRALSADQVAALISPPPAWPRFRGPGGLGISADRAVPIRWDEAAGSNIAWKADVKLPGASSPIVWGDHVYVTGATAASRAVYCFSTADGKLLWRKAVDAPGGGKQDEEFEGMTYASPTPVTDGRRVWAVFGNGLLICLDREGKQVWLRNLGLPKTGYGHSSSLMLHGSRLIVQLDQGADDKPSSRLLALDKATGKTVWEAAGADHRVSDSWSSPIVVAAPGGEQLITRGGGWLIAREPTTGKKLWQAESEAGNCSTSPIAAGGLVISAGHGEKTDAVNLAGKLIWSSEEGPPEVPSPVVVDGLVVLLEGASCDLTALRLSDGRKVLSHSIKQHGTEGFYASPVAIAGRIYALRADGTTLVFRITRKGATYAYEELGRGTLSGQKGCWASPAVAGGRLFIRSRTHLYCIAKTGGTSVTAKPPTGVTPPAGTRLPKPPIPVTVPDIPTRIAGASWPQYRGPNRSGVTTEPSGWTGKDWPLRKLWQVNVKEGCTSPLLVGGKVYVCGWEFTKKSRDRRNPHGTDTVHCLDAQTGKELWRHTYPQMRYCRHHTYDERNYGGPNATPTFDAGTGYLYTHGIDGDFRCLDTRRGGRAVWSMNIYDAHRIPQNPEVYPKTHNNDYGCISSPLIYGPWVIIEVGSPKHGLVIAYDKRTGKEAWTSEAKTWAGQTPGPQRITVGGLPCLATLTLEHLLVMRLDAGHEGKTVARFPWKAGWDENLALPAVEGDLVLLTGYHWINGGRNDGASAVCQVTLGGIRQLWKRLPCSKATGGTIYRGYAYIGSDNLHCVGIADGKPRWMDPDCTGDDFGCGASVIITGDEKLLYLSEKNTLYLAEGGHKSGKYTRLAKIPNVLKPFKGHTWPHVALAEGKILVKDKYGNLAGYAVGRAARRAGPPGTRHR